MRRCKDAGKISSGKRGSKTKLHPLAGRRGQQNQPKLQLLVRFLRAKGRGSADLYTAKPIADFRHPISRSRQRQEQMQEAVHFLRQPTRQHVGLVVGSRFGVEYKASAIKLRPTEIAEQVTSGNSFDGRRRKNDSWGQLLRREEGRGRHNRLARASVPAHLRLNMSRMMSCSSTWNRPSVPDAAPRPGPSRDHVLLPAFKIFIGSAMETFMCAFTTPSRVTSVAHASCAIVENPWNRHQRPEQQKMLPRVKPSKL